MTPIALKNIPDNVRKFLMLITHTEGTDRQGTPYKELFGFKNFEGYDKHPEIVVKTKNYSSSAAGRYQILKAAPPNTIIIRAKIDFTLYSLNCTIYLYLIVIYFVIC